MRKRLAVLAVLSVLVAGLAWADSTTGYWTQPTTCQGNPCVKVDYPATGAAAPNDKQPDAGVIGNNWDPDAGTNTPIKGLGPQSGLDLSGLKGFVVTVVLNGASPLDAGGTFTAGTLQAYVYTLGAQRWARAPDLDLTISAGNSAQTSYGFNVVADMGRVAFVPSSLGQPTSVHITGRR